MTFTLAYVGSRGRDLIVLTNPNATLALQTNGSNPTCSNRCAILAAQRRARTLE